MIIYCDGSFKNNNGVNTGSYGISYPAEGKTHSGTINNPVDSNYCEYYAVHESLKMAHSIKLDKVIVYTDSNNLGRQLRGHILPPKKKEYHLLYNQIKDATKRFGLCMIDYIASNNNLAHDIAKNII